MASASIFTTPDDPTPCDACGQQPAGNFITQIIHGTMTESSLCDNCATTQDLTIDASGVSIHDARCCYCGDKAAAGSLNHEWELPHRKLTMHYTCLRCTGLYSQFMLESLATTPQDLPLNEQLQRLQALAAETDARVKAAVTS